MLKKAVNFADNPKPAVVEAKQKDKESKSDKSMIGTKSQPTSRAQSKKGARPQGRSRSAASNSSAAANNASQSTAGTFPLDAKQKDLKKASVRSRGRKQTQSLERVEEVREDTVTEQYMALETPFEERECSFGEMDEKSSCGPIKIVYANP